MSKHRSKAVGKLGEDIACAFLMQKGYAIIARNFSVRSAEIDIVAKRGKTIHFVEVKSVSCEKGVRDGYRPEELVHQDKIRKIRSAGEYFLVSREIDSSAQIDVVIVFLDKSALRASCRLIEHAE